MFRQVAGVVDQRAARGAINIFTCTPSRRRWLWQRFGFWRSKRSQWVARNLVNRELGTITLRRLDILHSATWLRLGRFPEIPGSRREALRHVLFCSNFSGEWDPYRQAFLDVVSTGIRSMWGQSLGFPRGFPRRGTRYRLEAWQLDRLPPTVHYYRAYPGAAPSGVRGAVRLTRELEAFAVDAGRAGGGRDGLLAAFRQVQMRTRDGLGETPPRIVSGALFGPAAATGMSNFVSVLPILPGREEVTLARIERLPGGSQSPFRRVPGTHFARLAVLDRWKADFHPGRPIVLNNPWLLFAADFDGEFAVDEARALRMDPAEVARYVEAVDRVPELRAVWQDCVGFRPNRPLSELIEPSIIDRFVLFLDHGDLTLREIDHALRVKDLYVRSLARGQLNDEGGVKQFLSSVRGGVRRTPG